MTPKAVSLETTDDPTRSYIQLHILRGRDGRYRKHGVGGLLNGRSCQLAYDARDGPSRVRPVGAEPCDGHVLPFACTRIHLEDL